MAFFEDAQSSPNLESAMCFLLPTRDDNLETIIESSSAWNINRQTTTRITKSSVILE